MWRRLQPYVAEAATLRGGGCNVLESRSRTIHRSSWVALHLPAAELKRPGACIRGGGMKSIAGTRAVRGWDT